MADGGLELDSAGGGLNRARGWSEEVRGEVERLGVRRIEVGRRGTTDAAGDGGFARLCSRELEEKSGAQTARFTGCSMRGGARRRPDAGMGVGRAQWKHWSCTVLVLIEIVSRLTLRNSKFYIET